MANEIPLNVVENLPEVEPIEPDHAPLILEPILVNEDVEPEDEEEFEEDEPQEEEDMDVDIKEDEKETELTFPYEEMDHLNPPPPILDSEIRDVDESEDVVETNDVVEPENATVPVSTHEIGESSNATFLYDDGDSLLPSFMRRDINSLFGRYASLSKRMYIRETARELVEKKSRAKDKYNGKLISDLGEEVKYVDKVEERMTTLENVMKEFVDERIESKKLKRDLEEADNHATKEVCTGYDASCDYQVGSRQCECRYTERTRQENVRSTASGSSRNAAPVARECTYAGFMKCNPITFCGTEGAVELRRPALTCWKSKVAVLGADAANRIGWTEMKKLMTKEFCPMEEIKRMEHELWGLRVRDYNIVAYTQIFNELALMCPRMVEPEEVKIGAYIRGFVG
ncbi:putative reverse transcriptase domain-containing protein [Tanacetum coccineum]|uniref:Reverse transcriptase domain-containing protein n=1 Tax=Tanacetum coccineum TaxID=301880 RepID=A0ABQ5DBC0_9ASTR